MRETDDERSTDGLRRTVVFAAALLMLLFFARGGSSRVILLVLFVVYVVAATVWVRGQYADYLDGRSYRLDRTGFLVLLAMGAAATLVLGVAGDGGYLLLVVILGYLVAGFLVMRWREDGGRDAWAWGAVLLGLGLGFAVLGSLLLGRTPSGWAVRPSMVGFALVALGVLVLMPPGVSLLSESSILRLSEAGGTRRAVVGGSGGALFLAATGLAWLWAGSLWAVTALSALALFVVAVASSTLADLAAWVAVLALLGATPGQEKVPDDLEPRAGAKVLVALGDSYMSGEGASVYYQGTDEGGGNQCRRAPSSWAAMAGLSFDFEGLVFLACSGARTRNVRFHSQPAPAPRRQPGEPGTQLQVYRERQRATGFVPQLVVLSIGGNDAGFSTIGLMCLAPGDCSTRGRTWTRALDQVGENVRTTYDEVRERFPDTPVVVVPYPNPIDLRDTDCGQVSLTPDERRFVAGFVADLNARLRAAAGGVGFYYLAEMEGALAGQHLQLCDPLNGGRPGVHFLGLRSVNGIADQRFNPANWAHSSFHPNERGHAAMLRVFQRWRARNQPLSALAPPPPPVPPSAPTAGGDTSGATRPPCDLFDVSPSGCRPQGAAWAERQLGAAVLTTGWVALLAALGAWLAAVAFFGWRRNVY